MRRCLWPWDLNSSEQTNELVTGWGRNYLNSIGTFNLTIERSPLSGISWKLDDSAGNSLLGQFQSPQAWWLLTSLPDHCWSSSDGLTSFFFSASIVSLLDKTALSLAWHLMSLPEWPPMVVFKEDLYTITFKCSWCPGIQMGPTGSVKVRGDRPSTDS